MATTCFCPKLMVSGSSALPDRLDDDLRLRAVRPAVIPLTSTYASQLLADDVLQGHRPVRAVRRHPGAGCLVASPAQPSRWSRWSPTRIALAMAVRAGFTALMLGKKLVSTT